MSTYVKFRFAFLVLLSISLTSNSCTMFHEILGLSSIQPKLSLNKIQIKNLSFEKLELDLELKVQNIDSKDLKIKNLEYSLHINEYFIASGKKNFTLEVPSKKIRTLKIPITLNTQQSAEIVKKILSGQKNPLFARWKAATYFQTSIGYIKLNFKDRQKIS